MTRATVRQIPPSDFWLRPLPAPRRRRLIRRLTRSLLRGIIIWALVVTTVAVVLAAVQLAWWLLRRVAL